MKKTIFTNVLLTGLSILFALLICELLLRAINPVQIVGLAHQPTIYEINEENGYAYIKNAEGWLHRNSEIDNLVKTNSNGFHDIGRNQKQNTLRIASIGDSFTASIHVPISTTWTQILEQELRNSLASPIEVINLGLDGSGTDIQLNILSSYLQSNEIDVVILAFYDNDIMDMKRHKIFREIYGGYVITYQNSEQRTRLLEYISKNEPSLLTRALYNKSYVFRAIMYLLRKQSLLRSNFIGLKPAGIKLLQYSEKELASKVESIFSKLIKLSQTRNFALFVVTVPTKNNPNNSMDMLVKNISKEQNETLKIVDVVPTIQNLLNQHQLEYNQLFWKYDGHFNSTGNQIFGLSVASALNHEISLLSNAVSNKPLDQTR